MVSKILTVVYTRRKEERDEYEQLNRHVIILLTLNNIKTWIGI